MSPTSGFNRRKEPAKINRSGSHNGRNTAVNSRATASAFARGRFVGLLISIRQATRYRFSPERSSQDMKSWVRGNIPVGVNYGGDPCFGNTSLVVSNPNAAAFEISFFLSSGLISGALAKIHKYDLLGPEITAYW